MPGSRLRRDKLPYPAFRRVNAERGDGKPSPYALRNSTTTEGQASCLPSLWAGPTSGHPRGVPLRGLAQSRLSSSAAFRITPKYRRRSTTAPSSRAYGVWSRQRGRPSVAQTAGFAVCGSSQRELPIAARDTLYACGPVNRAKNRGPQNRGPTLRLLIEGQSFAPKEIDKARRRVTR
jgi:hypothetical protein